MILPNKITPYNKSILSKLHIIPASLLKKDRSPIELWLELHNQFEDINEFILTIDIAFFLGSIQYSKDNKVIKYVKTNNL